MAISDVFPPHSHRNYEVIYPSSWDTPWEINQLLGVLQDLILIVDCERQEIQVLPTQASTNLIPEFNWIEFIIEQLQKQESSDQSTSMIEAVLSSQTANQIVYQYHQEQKNYYILVEIYPLSKTAIMAVCKDLSQCLEVQRVLHNSSQPSETKASAPGLQMTQECLRKQIEERQRIESQLQARKIELETLIDNAGDSIVRIDQKLRYLYANRKVAFVFGISPKKMLGKTNRELGLPLSVCKQWDWHAQLVLDTGQPQQFQFDLETGERWRSFETLIVPELQHQGEIKTLLATTRDITKQKRTLAELKQQNQFLQLLTEIALKIQESLELDLILKTTVDEVQKVLNVDRVIILKLNSNRGGTIVQEAVLPQWSSLLGQKIFSPYLNLESRDSNLCNQVVSFADIEQENLESSDLKLMQYFQVKASLMIPIKLGKENIDSSLNQQQNLADSQHKSNIWGFIIAHQCIENRQWTALETNFLKQLSAQVGIALRQAQLITELRQAQQYLSCHFENSPLAVIEWDEQLRIKRWSSQAEKTFGKTSSEMLGQNWSQFQEMFATNSQQVTQAMINLIDGIETHQIIETQNRTQDGRVIDCEWYNSVVRDEKDRLVSLLSLAQNVSDRKQTEQALVQSEERFRTIFEQAAVGFALVDPTGKLIRVNPRYCDITGYSVEELIGQSVHDLIHSEELETLNRLGQFQEQGSLETFTLEKQYIRATGQLNWVQIFVSPLSELWEGNNCLVLALEDIQERKQTEEELHRVNRALRTISDCNQALVRATTESELLNDVCQILVHVGGYHFAWVGYPQPTPEKRIIPVAKAGFEAGYLDNLTITWEDNQSGQLPSGIAMRTGKTCVFQNINIKANHAPWKEQARQRGFASCIALPLIMTSDQQDQHLEKELTPLMIDSFNPTAFGVLNLYSTQANAFDQAEVKLLKELVDDIVYGIVALKVRASHAETEKKFRQLAENIHDVFWITNAQGNQFVYVSPAYQQIWGRNSTEIYENFQTFINTIHPQDQQRVLQALQSPDGGVFDLEYRILRPDGSCRWIWDRGFPIVNESGQLERRAGIAKDITHRKQTEQLLRQSNEELELRVAQRTAELETANERLHFELMQRHRTEFKLRKSEEQYRTLVNNFPNGAVFLFDLDLRYTIADGMGLGAKGLSRSMLEGKTIYQALPSALLTIVEPLYRSALAGETKISEVEYDGRIYYHQSLPVRNELGEILAGMVVMQDITERKQAEAERDKLIAIIEATPDFISSEKPGGEVVYFNQSARRILGLNSQEKISDQNIIASHPQWANDMIQNEGIPTAIREGAWIGETAIFSYDGREIPLSQLIIAHKNNEGRVHLLSTIARDITEQKQSEANLREAERRWRSLLENVRLLVVGLDRQGKVEYVNPFFLELTGYTQTEVLGKSWLENFQLPCNQRPNSIAFDQFLDYYFKPYNQQLILTKSGEEKIIAWNNTLLKNLQGEAIGMMSIGEDITERYGIERMKDEFISVVSHELRTPLTSIHGGLNLLSTRLVEPNSERGKHVMKIAAESAERLVRLVNDILELERLESGKICLTKQKVNAGDLLLRATEQMQVMANRSGINLEVYSPNLEFDADSDRILQVLTNLLSNAIKFSDSGDTICLSVQEEPTINDEKNPSVLFKIQDQGRGIPQDKIERIFERFHQVDASDSRKKGGTGLGLAICRSIVEQHGGRIWVQSKLDEGSCFYFTLPMDINRGES